MEVVQEWRGAVDTVGKTASWGADAQKLMHVMMGQFGAPDQQQASEVTLDLLGKTGHVDEFLEVDTDREPMPSGWEKCLDLKTGELYFVSKSMGMRTSEDPRKQQQQPQSQQQQQQGVIAPRTPARPAHEFLASKKVETLRASTSGSSGSGEQDQPAAAPPGRRLWNDHTVVRSPESNLELNLNLSPSPPPVPAAAHTTTSQAAVCTMEMVQQALKRTEKAMGKREAPSSSFSAGSLSWTSRSSPSTSSSSTSKSADAPAQQQPRMNYEAETSSGSGGAVELAMGKSRRCSMMVMVQKKDPKCPSCASSKSASSPLAPQPSAKDLIRPLHNHQLVVISDHDATAGASYHKPGRGGFCFWRSYSKPGSGGFIMSLGSGGFNVFDGRSYRNLGYL